MDIELGTVPDRECSTTCDCIVESILKQKFISCNFEEKKQIIKNGRPTPVLKLSTRVKTCVRQFNNNIYMSNEWLTGCPKLQKLFCWSCLLFSNEKCVWNSGGYSDMGNVHKAIKKHSISQSHLRSITLQKTFGKARGDHMLDGQKRIINIQHNERVRKNREILKQLIDVVCFLGKQELAFGGYNETKELTNKGNYVELVNLIGEYDDKLKHHLENSSVFTGLSNLIQKDLIVSVSTVLLLEIRKEINETNFVAIQLDEMMDVTNLCQLSPVFRFVDRDGQVRERFLGFHNISEDRSADALYNTVVQLLLEFNCGDKIVAQTYDSAAVVSGQLNDLQKKVKETFPQATFVHCYAHRLNLVLAQAVSVVSACRVFFLTLNGLAAFFSKSTRRTKALNEVHKRLPNVALTCWNYSSCLVEVVYEYRNSLVTLFQRIIDPEEKWDQDSYNAARGFSDSLQDFNFNFLLNVFAEIFCDTARLFDILEAKSNDIGYCTVKVKEYHDCIKGKREEFSRIWEKTYSCSEVNQPKKYQKTYEECDIRTSYQRLYCEIMDIIVQQLEDRFFNLYTLKFLELLNQKNYEQYRRSFPELGFQTLKDSYGNKFDFVSLKAQLIGIYSSEELYDKSVGELLMFLMSNDLQNAYCEVVKLCELLLTIPAVSALGEQSFSAMKKIKSYVRNSQLQYRHSNLAFISIEKELLCVVKKRQDFYDMVIDDFAQKESRIQLQYK